MTNPITMTNPMTNATPDQILVRFHHDRVVTRAESHVHTGHYQAGERAAFPEPLAVALVLEGVAACDAFTRIRFVAPTTIEPPSPHAGVYAATAQLFVVDTATAAWLVANGQAVAA